jgi:hypothetical protein
MPHLSCGFLRQSDFLPQAAVAENTGNQGSMHGVAGTVGNHFPQNRFAQKSQVAY